MHEGRARAALKRTSRVLRGFPTVVTPVLVRPTGEKERIDSRDPSSTCAQPAPDSSVERIFSTTGRQGNGSLPAGCGGGSKPMTSHNSKTVSELFPAFAEELVDMVRRSERPQLAVQIPSLRVIDRCRCGARGCAHFYTAPPPRGSYGPGHDNIMLEPAGDELIILDIVGEKIVAVEVLDRPDVGALLDQYLPL